MTGGSRQSLRLRVCEHSGGLPPLPSHPLPILPRSALDPPLLRLSTLCSDHLSSAAPSRYLVPIISLDSSLPLVPLHSLSILGSSSPSLVLPHFPHPTHSFPIPVSLLPPPFSALPPLPSHHLPSRSSPRLSSPPCLPSLLPPHPIPSSPHPSHFNLSTDSRRLRLHSNRWEAATQASRTRSQHQTRLPLFLLCRAGDRAPISHPYPRAAASRVRLDTWVELPRIFDDSLLVRFGKTARDQR